MSEETRRWRLVCYDIRDPRRYRKIYKVIRGEGDRLQYSVFRCRLDDRQTEELRWRMLQHMAPEDALLIVDLCPSCAGRVVSRNHLSDWKDPSSEFRILGRATDQAPAAVRGRKPRRFT
jgi:CRISPR-associated protein Cas2